VVVLIDPDRDFAEDYRSGRDPDAGSSRLYEWHLALWSREVPELEPFDLTVVWDRRYTIRLATTDGRSFRLASDGLMQTWSAPGWRHRLSRPVVEEIAADRDDFERIASTIGGYLLWPLNRSGQVGQSINQTRGTTIAIADRFDLTLECIRRHYDEPDAVNPLGECLIRYGDFFALFGDFERYARFWLLEDLLTPDGGVRSFMTGEPIDEMRSVGVAETVEEYARFREGSIAFVEARNERIRQLGL
jgi:hypothetical protein